MADLEFVPLDHDALQRLSSWLGQSHVARWWREPSDLAAVTEAYGPLIDGLDPSEGFIVEYLGRPIGYIQRYLIDDNDDWQETIRQAVGEAGGIGIDYLIGEQEFVGRGIGRQMIAAFVTACWDRYPLAAQITVAVQQDNLPSWKALEAAGFRRVWDGILESSDPSDRGPSFVYVARRPD